MRLKKVDTERPDKAVAAMLEGRVVILVDGSPFSLIVLAVFTQFYQTTEDYVTRFLMQPIHILLWDCRFWISNFKSGYLMPTVFLGIHTKTPKRFPRCDNLEIWTYDLLDHMKG